MKKVFFLFVLTIATNALAQDYGSVQGSILDGELFNEPLLMANVSIKNTPFSTQTNFRGNFEFGEIEEGPYELLVQFLGYEPMVIPINVKAGSTIDIMETLYAKVSSLPSTAEMTTVQHLPAASRYNTSSPFKGK